MLESNGFDVKKSLPVAARPAASSISGTGPRRGRARRALEELLVAEIFLVQATIESASALEQGLSQARRSDNPGEVLRSTGEQVLKSYRDRLDFYRTYRDGTHG